MKTLVFLIGPPAVGKMTVGRELSRLTGLPLFHNHLSIEAVLPVFDFGTPPFNRLVGMLRKEMIREVAASDLPGLIFTFVWAFDAPREQAYVESLMKCFEGEGHRTVFVELWAPQEVRLERNAHPDRLAEKASKRDVEASTKRLIFEDENWQFHSQGGFPLEPHLFLENTDLSAAEAAARIASHFGLPRVRDD